jgi:hypothetical protein
MDLLHKVRLSVQRVSKQEWDFILALEQQPQLPDGCKTKREIEGGGIFSPQLAIE